MGIARWMLRPDARLAAGVLGMAAAILLPLAATLVLSGLPERVDPGGGWIAYRADGGPLDPAALGTPRVAVAEAERDGRAWVAFLAGGPPLAPGHALLPGAVPDGGATGATVRLGNRTLAVDGPPPAEWPLLPPGRPVAHPADLGLGLAPATAAILAAPVEVPGWTVQPQRGADAFELAALARLRDAAGVVVAASLPAVALVAGVFARQEARERAHAGAVLASLGGAGAARLLLASRVLLLVAGGAALALAVSYGLWRWGGPLFHPEPFPRLGFALAWTVPTLAAAAAGWAATAGFSRRIQEGLRGSREPQAGARLPLPLPVRPLVLGSRVFLVLLACAALFAADVGFPLAAGQVPASLVGGPGEWVVGGGSGLRLGEGVPAAPGSVLAYDEAVEAAVAETVAPTLLGGAPVTLRCGRWEDLAPYHGIHLASGQAPSGDGIVLARRLADRHGWREGDVLALQGAHVPFVARSPVVGIGEGGGVVADEAFCGEALGQALAGVPAGQATLLRVRPQTAAAKAAIEREEPRIEVVALEVRPAEPEQGQVAQAVVRGVNLGATAGSRPLALRVNGQGVGHATLAAGPFGHGEAAIPFVVPAGPFRVEVNPEVLVQPAAAPLRVSVPPLAFPGEPLPVGVRAAGAPVAGVVVGLFPDSAAAAERRDPLQVGTTGADGTAFLVAPESDAVVATLEGPLAAAEVRAGTTPGAADLAVEAAWLDPPDLRPGQQGRVLATVRNRGGLAGAQDFEVRRGDAIIQFLPARLDAGQAATFEAPLALDEPAAALTVGGRPVAIATASADAAGDAPPPVAVGAANAGQAAQARLADRVFGDARAVLFGLAGVSLGTCLAVVVLATRRALQSRGHVLGVLRALGEGEGAVRSRAAWEAGVMAGLAMLAVLPLAKAAFLLLATPLGPTAFAHALPDPIDGLFSVQAVAAFSALAALAAYGLTGRVASRLP